MKQQDILQETLRHADDLPTLSIVILEAITLLEDTRSRPGQITEIIKGDQVLTSRILRAVNSPYYAIPGRVSSVERAILYLGTATVAQLLLTVSIVRFSRLGGEKGIDLREFWKHSLGVGVAAEVVARHIGYVAPEDAFTAGVLHDVGKLALNRIPGDPFQIAVEEALTKGIPLRQSERAQGLPTHDYVGRILAERWRFPAGIVAVINSHHQDIVVREQILTSEQMPLVDIVILANVLCRRYGIGNGGDLTTPEIEKGLLTRLGISRLYLPQIKGEMTRRLEMARVFLDLLGSDL